MSCSYSQSDSVHCTIHTDYVGKNGEVWSLHAGDAGFARWIFERLNGYELARAELAVALAKLAAK